MKEIPESRSRLARRLPLLALLLFAACTDPRDPQAIIDRAIATHGGPVIDHSVIDFDQRGRHYRATRDGGAFTYERIFTDSTGAVRDVLSNDGFYREIDGQRVDLPEERALAFESSVNSVLYFALLPYNLNDAAVQKRYLSEAVVEGEPYHKVEVTFHQEGGGKDYQDRFVYWVHRDRSTIDYIAYDFLTDGGGSRFRKAMNPRVVEGVRFADYLNYIADDLQQPGLLIESYDEKLEAGTLRLLSEINIENIQVVAK
ncbi:MAG: DUF6503 family protein [Rhodothermales bacterium]